MPSAANVARQLAARIAQSEHSVTIIFPAARTPVDGTVADAPLNPFAGTSLPAPKLLEAPTTPIRAPLTLKCLWLDSPSSATAQSRQNVVEKLGWYADSDAVARVLASDIVTAPGQTCFDACDHVEHLGRHFVVLHVTPLGSSFAVPSSYTVWLKTARRQ